MQSAYAQLLQFARDQAAAVARGDVDAAIGMLQARAAIIANAPAARAGDADGIREILHLDRELSSAIRERMLAIRAEAARGQQGRVALTGYRPAMRRTALAIDTT